MARNKKPPVEPLGAEGDRRRPRQDWVQTAVTLTTGIGWVGVFIITTLLDRASPEQSTFIDNYLGTPVRTYWNTQLVRQSLFVLILIFALGLIGLFVGLTRMRRKDDKLNKANILLLALTVLGIVIFLVRFGDML